MITMLLGGLWHGAGWNFVIWGGLHGGYLMINHAWSNSSYGKNIIRAIPGPVYLLFCWALTFIAVVVAWVFFRAESFGGAIRVLSSMFGFSGVTSAIHWTEIIPDAGNVPTMLTALLVIVVCLPNSIEMTRKYQPVIAAIREVGKPDVLLNWIRWKPSSTWGYVVSGIGFIAIIQIYRLNDLTEFIYFNF